MTRKIYLNVVCKVIITTDNTNIDDVISELELVSGDDTSVEDFIIESYEIEDSK